MKRLSVCIFMISVLLSACSVQRFSDVKMFVDKFNAAEPPCTIASESAVITREDEALQYNFLLSVSGCEYLLRLETADDTLRIARCSVTVSGSPEELKGECFRQFSALCACAVSAFTNGGDAGKVFSGLNMPEPDGYMPAVPQYWGELHYRYVYAANTVGAYFCAESISLCPDSEEGLTLREYDGAQK